ncbi:PPE domain-containing protein [Actinokineospora terrae]|uniref:PPE family protein n=1 Tax=Actinokineospora terrae TaxID=155974 RepID=A0A1H9UP89_9PSEU|nr:PPE domain-containing protein [Actinokineospora terrae]SES10927.1 PPE family protein [Actinokineospora terrae]
MTLEPARVPHYGQFPEHGQFAGFDSPRLAELDNWWVWDHHDLKRMVHGIDIGKIDAAAHGWRDLGARFVQSFEDFSDDLSKIVGVSWTGEAAERASATVNPYRAWATDLSDSMHGTADKLAEVAQAVRNTKAHLPEPVDFNWRRNMTAALTGAAFGGGYGPLAAASASAAGVYDMRQQFDEREAALARARQVMATYFTSPYVYVDSSVPAFPPPPGTRTGDSPQSSSNVYQATASDSRPQWTFVDRRPVFVPTHVSPSGPPDYTAPSRHPADYLPPAAHHTTVSSGVVSSPVVPSGTVPPNAVSPTVSSATPTVPTVPASTVPSSAQPPITGGAVPAGSRMRTGVGSGPNATARTDSRGPRPWSATVPPGQFGPTGGPASAKGSATAPRPGSAGAPGPMGARGSSTGDEDTEHRNRYLTEIDKDEVFGAGIQAAPPVIGEQQ